MNTDAGLDDLMRAAARVNQSVAQVRGYGESAGGRVKIEVVGDGEISNMYLDDQTRTMPAHELSRAIRDAHRTAMNDAAQRVQVLRSQITDSSYVTTLLNKLGSTEPRNLNAPAESNIVSRRQHAVGGMTEHELMHRKRRSTSTPSEGAVGDRNQRRLSLSTPARHSTETTSNGCDHVSREPLTTSAEFSSGRVSVR